MTADAPRPAPPEAPAAPTCVRCGSPIPKPEPGKRPKKKYCSARCNTLAGSAAYAARGGKRAARHRREERNDPERIRAEYQRFYDFVADSDPALVDAWHFGENIRVGESAHPTSPEPPTPELARTLKDRMTDLAHLTPEDWDKRRGADPIARTINACRDIVDDVLGGNG